MRPAAVIRSSLVAIAILAVGPAPAPADPVDAYIRLDRLDVRPAPLVPTWVPAVRGAGGPGFDVAGARNRRGYALRLEWTARQGVVGVIFLEARAFPSVAAGRREFVRQGYRARPTRVRGRAGVLLRRSGGAILVWRERGVVFWIGTGTVRRVPLGALRTVAQRLEPLEGAWSGSRYEEDADGYGRSFGGVLVTTASTVSGTLEWGGPCTGPDGTVIDQRGGDATVRFARRTRGAFRIDLATATGVDPMWQGAVDGVAAGGGLTLTPQISGVVRVRNILGETREARCDPGGAPLAFRRLRPPD